jgi:GNAT superfamily N-acetyltransferase
MDMLVKLYAPRARVDLPAAAWLRKPIGPEHAIVATWVADRFGAGWGSEARVALSNRPVSLWIAARGAELLGFACYDATARGYFGPIGVADTARGQGVGAALLTACLDDMRGAGYGYAIVGGAGSPEFFERVAGAVEIADSTPGIYAHQLR